jgi:von Willebrand factor type A domain
MDEALNRVDLCFVVDTTGSMGPFIEAAKRELLAAIDRLRADNALDLQVGLVEFRDHPPQDSSFVTRVYPLTGDLRTMQAAINGLRADGGGDAPEAVYDGVHEACTAANWRAHSCRFAMLVGDSPPHGFRAAAPEEAAARGRRRHGGYGDSWADGCPCGLTAHSVAAAAENQGVTVHGLCMGSAPVTLASFAEIAAGTGGQCAPATSAQAVVENIARVLAEEFRELPFDAQVLETVRRQESLEASPIADALGRPRLQVAAALARLGKRGFLGS